MRHLDCQAQRLQHDINGVFIDDFEHHRSSCIPRDFVAFAVLGWFTPFEEKDEEGITVFANCANALAPLIHRFFYTLDGPPNRFGFEYRIHSFLECGLPRRRKRNITMPVAIQGLLGATCLFGCLHDISRLA